MNSEYSQERIVHFERLAARFDLITDADGSDAGTADGKNRRR